MFLKTKVYTADTYLESCHSLIASSTVAILLATALRAVLSPARYFQTAFKKLLLQSFALFLVLLVLS